MGEVNFEETSEYEEIKGLMNSYEEGSEDRVIEYMRSNPERIQDLAQFLSDGFPNSSLPVAVKLGALLEKAIKG